MNEKSQTRLCKLLEIKYPIVQAPMAWVTDAAMVAAISKAGGMGTLGPNAGAITISRDAIVVGARMREQIRRVREITDKPFAVNIVVPGPGEEAFSENIVRVCVEEHIPVAIVSQGSARFYTDRLHAAGIKVMHVVGSPKHAVSAEKAGVDAVITSGTEGGGHSNRDLLTTFILVPQIADSIKIPIIAGGGVGDGRGLVAALALGAAGVYMGTRFIATKECPVHQNWKDTLVTSDAIDTVSIVHGRKTGEDVSDIQAEMRFGSVRVLRNEFTKQLLEIEANTKDPEKVNDFFISRPPGYEGKELSRSMIPALYGDMINGGVGTGQVVGMIKDIPSCKQLIDRIINEADNIFKNLVDITS
jgi:enoyl-[acyl-carrier protein] reductase II